MNPSLAPKTPSSPSRHRVGVVGAGIAGLSAAFRLQQAGFEVVVLESSQHVGGRMWTEEIDGYRIDVAAAMLPDSYHEMQRLIQDAGLSNETLPSGDTYGFLRDGKVHRFGRHALKDLIRTRMLSIDSKLRLIRLAVDAKRIGDRINFRDLSNAYEADEASTSYTARRLNQELFDYIIEPLSVNYYFAPPEQLSMAHIYLAVREALGIGYFNAPTGVSFLPIGLAKQLDVRLNTKVTSLEEHHDSVTLTYEGPDHQQHRETLAACVIALPGPAVADVWPGLPSGMRTYLSGLRYSTCLHVSFGLTQRPDESAMWIFVPRREFPDGLGVCLDHNRAPGRAPDGRALITLYWPTKQSEAMIDLPDEQVVAAALRDLERVGLFPDMAKQIEMTRVSRCRPCVPLTHPGSIAELRLGRDSLSPTSRIVLAGDYFSFGSTNSALTSGESAASQLATTLGHPVTGPGQPGTN
ncbi:protoporphyrinogen/coproporphyrinogen oxidase [Streptomyces bacillaris]|uniref:protoporphyrinogen/coproporphyrinogen oxidase n=1 Tax=Streptomyces bacillaris TaxID=68179 RepID=UPI00334BD499